MSLPPPPPPPPSSPPPPPGARRVDRTAARRAQVRGLGIAIVVLLVLGIAAAVTWDEAEDFPEVWDPRVADLAAFVEDARGVDFDHPVEVEFLTAEEYRAAATSDTDDLEDEVLEELERSSAELRAFGVASGKLDLAQALNQVSDAGTLAFYDPVDRRVRVRGTELTIGLRVTLVHELTHALQDQNFDLKGLLSDDVDSGALTARRAVAEGDALRIERQFVDEELSDEERAAYEAEYDGEVEASIEGTAGVPDFLSASFAIPYELGSSLVRLLDTTDGNDGVDDLFTDPPSTEEHLFDPASYVADEQAVPPALGIDDERLDGPPGVLGPPTWYLVLAQRIDSQLAFRAALGWGGDQYVQFERDDRTCVRAVFRGDTEEDEAEMATALEAWAAAMPGGLAKATSVKGRPTLDSCDVGPDVDLGVREISSQLLALPATFAYLESDVAPAVGVEASRCYARVLLEGVSVEQLTDDAQVEAVQRKVESNGIAARQRCGSGER